MALLTPWQRAIAALAMLKVLVGVGLYAAAFGATGYPTPRDLLMVAHVVAFGAAAALLIVLGRRDLRATVLGVAFLLTAAVFADNARATLGTNSSTGLTMVRALFALQVDAFSAYFLWFFIQEFPRIATFGARRNMQRLAMSASLVVGLALFAMNAAYFVASFAQWQSSVPELLWIFARENDHGWYWPMQYALWIPGLPALIWKARVAPISERRRVSILIGALLVGTAPTVGWVFLSIVWPSFRQLLPLRTAGWLIYPTLLSTPFTTAYAVLVHQALNARLIVRRAMQYAFARYTVMTAASVPVLVFLIALYRRREQSMTDLVGGANGIVFATLALLAVVAARSRRGLIEKLDRRFFREQYDARQILGALVDRCRRATSCSELADSLRTEIDRALHLAAHGVLFLDQEQASFVSPRDDMRPLPAQSQLARLFASADGAVEVDLERGNGFVAQLPSEDRYWLADTGARLLLPMRDTERQVVGLLLLGEKKSELPYSAEDRMLLSTVVSAAAISLAYLSVHPRPAVHGGFGTAVGSSAELAAMCIVCGLLDDQHIHVCGRCGSPMVRSPVPRLLAGKFRIVERIGEGGMGVVYRGLDLALDRPVAIKTLPQMSPDRAMRLRREARAMAAISHPNLALIYGGESWNGMPILIVEFLPGGTLAQQLLSGPLVPNEALALGIALADVIGALHRAAILHRDVKPSNIGFAADGTPKLLDFGLAHLLSGAAGLDRLTTDARLAAISPLLQRTSFQDLRATASVGGEVVGTPLYLSPEALAGRPPQPSFDLWSICVVLFEAIAGSNPFQDVSLPRTLQRIETCSHSDLSTFVPHVDAELSAFFRRAFSADVAARPRSAGALRDQLTSLRALSALPPT